MCVFIYTHNVCENMSGQRVNGLGIMIRGAPGKRGVEMEEECFCLSFRADLA